MKTIYKYYAAVDDNFTIDMPADAQVLCVQMQGERPQIWALVDTEAPTEPRHFHWRGTGRQAHGLGRYVGTVQIMHGGALVFHLFEA